MVYFNIVIVCLAVVESVDQIGSLLGAELCCSEMQQKQVVENAL